MMGRNHVLVGATGWLIAAPVISKAVGHPLDPGQIATGTLLAAGAALLPDIDHPDSTVARTIGPLTQGLAWVVARLSGGHRHKTHSLLFCAAMGAVAWVAVTYGGQWGVFALFWPCAAWALRLLGPRDVKNALFGFGVPVVAAGIAWWIAVVMPPQPWMAWCVFAGALLHLVGDICTKGPMPLLWPFPGRFSTNLIHTNGTVEHILSFVLIAAVIALSWVYFGGEIINRVQGISA